MLTITRTGTFTDPRYGQFEISRALLEEMVRNFDANAYGQDIALDVAHRPSDGAAGYFRKLILDGNKLRGEVELTAHGVEAIEKRGFRYVSAEYDEHFRDNESGNDHGAVLLGAGLVVRPAIKRLDPIVLGEAGVDASPLLLGPRLLSEITEETRAVFDKYLKQLREKLTSLKLGEALIKTLTEAFQQAGKGLTEEPALKVLAEQFEAAGKQLAEQQAKGGGEVKLEISMPEPGGKTLSEDDVRRLMAETQASASASAKKLEEAKEAKVESFRKALSEEKGLESLTADDRKALGEFETLIFAEMPDGAVKALAERAIALAHKMAARDKLAAMGYGGTVAGSPRIHVDEQSTKKLQETIDENLKRSMAYGNRAIKVPEKVSPFVAKVLEDFDRLNARRLHAETKTLAGEETNIGDTDLPVGFQRTVIREALSDLNILQVVNTLTDPTATATTQIPYEQRDTSAVMNDGIVYEGQGIPGASIRQLMDLAYILPVKLALKLTNEVMHFSRASQINWDAWGRNVESNARVVRELVARRIANELQRAADAYGAVAVVGETFDSQLTGSASTLKTTNFPIVRPHQQYDLQGNTVGSVDNAIAIVLNGSAITAFDGSGTQSAGTYYRVTSYNMGYIQLVDEAGDPVTPADTGVNTIGYHYATNMAKFDMDVPAGTTKEKHLNGLLQAVGARKAVLSGDRFVMPNFLLMSPVLNDEASNAENFTAQARRDGANTSSEGDLAAVKGVAAFGTNAPSIDLGDERIIMGPRGTLTYTVSKPFMTGQPFEAVDANGRPTGEKVAYGEEYSAIKVPSPIRNRLTSVLAYSVTGR